MLEPTRLPRQERRARSACTDGNANRDRVGIRDRGPRLPEGKELEALFDRFLLRFDVGYLLVASNLRGVLVGPEPAITATLTMDELRRAQSEVAAVKVTDDTVDALLANRDACRGVGEDDKRDAIAAVFGAFGQQVSNKASETGPTKAFSVDELW